MKTDHCRHDQSGVQCLSTQHSNRGQTLVEYVLIIVVISLVVIAAMKFFEVGIATTYNNAASLIPPSP